MILIVSSVFPPEPVVSATISYSLAQKLAEKYQVTVLTPRPTRPLGFIMPENYHTTGNYSHVVLNSFVYPKSRLLGRLYESYSFGKHTAKFIEKNHKAIQCIYLNVWPLFAQYYIVRAAKKHAISTVIHMQDIYPESLSNKVPLVGSLLWKLLLPLDKYCLKNASGVITVSENMTETYVETRKIDKRKFLLVHNWQDENEFLQLGQSNLSDKSANIKKRPFTFLYLGNIGPVAGVEFLLKGFLKAGLDNTSLIIAGNGSRKTACIAFAAKHKLQHVIFKEVPWSKVPEIQREADVLMLPLIKGAALSSIPSKLPAYMFSAKPIIACVDSESYTSKVLHQANCGWVLPPEDTEKLAQTMNHIVVQSRETLEKLGNNGFVFAMINFSKKHNLPKLSSYVESFITGNEPEAIQIPLNDKP